MDLTATQIGNLCQSAETYITRPPSQLTKIEVLGQQKNVMFFLVP